MRHSTLAGSGDHLPLLMQTAVSYPLEKSPSLHWKMTSDASTVLGMLIRVPFIGSWGSPQSTTGAVNRLESTHSDITIVNEGITCLTVISARIRVPPPVVSTHSRLSVLRKASYTVEIDDRTLCCAGIGFNKHPTGSSWIWAADCRNVKQVQLTSTIKVSRWKWPSANLADMAIVDYGGALEAHIEDSHFHPNSWFCTLGGEIPRWPLSSQWGSDGTWPHNFYQWWISAKPEQQNFEMPTPRLRHFCILDPNWHLATVMHWPIN